MFQAVGAYTAGVLTLGPDTGNGGFRQYILGLRLGEPLAVLLAGVVAGALALVVGIVALRRLRTDYQAMVMLVISVIALLVVENVTGLSSGPAGLSLIPQPYGSRPLSTPGYQWFYVALTAATCLFVYLFVHRVTSSPLGRALRATRDNEDAAQALGKDVVRLRLFIFVMGGAIAGISGAVLILFIGAWSPGSWAYVGTLAVLTPIIVGRTGNNFGLLLGALLVPVAFNEATRFIPQFGSPWLADALPSIARGGLALVLLSSWPRAIPPHRPPRFPP